MLPALRGPAVFVPHIIRVCLSDRWLNYMPRFLFVWTGSFLYGYFSFRQIACLYFCLFVILLYCVSYLIVLGAGFLASGGKGVPFSSFVVISGWSP